jgi:hypothetical protein
MDEKKKGTLLSKIAHNPPAELLLGAILALSLMYGMFMMFRDGLYYSIVTTEAVLTEDSAWFSYVFFGIFGAGGVFLLLRLVYNTSQKLYVSTKLKAYFSRPENMGKLPAPVIFPLPYREYAYLTIIFIIIYNVIIGSIRLLYINAPYLYYFIESIAPILINFGLMLLLFIILKKLYLSERDTGMVLSALAFPYTLIMLLLL